MCSFYKHKLVGSCLDIGPRGILSHKSTPVLSLGKINGSEPKNGDLTGGWWLWLFYEPHFH